MTSSHKSNTLSEKTNNFKNILKKPHGELHKFVVLQKRWVVERSFAWLEKYRRLWKNCEWLLDTSLQMVVLAFVSVIVKRF